MENIIAPTEVNKITWGFFQPVRTGFFGLSPRWSQRPFSKASWPGGQRRRAPVPWGFIDRTWFQKAMMNVYYGILCYIMVNWGNYTNISTGQKLGKFFEDYCYMAMNVYYGVLCYMGKYTMLYRENLGLSYSWEIWGKKWNWGIIRICLEWFWILPKKDWDLGHVAFPIQDIANCKESQHGCRVPVTIAWCFGDGKRHQGFVNLAKLCVFRQGFVPWQPAKR